MMDYRAGEILTTAKILAREEQDRYATANRQLRNTTTPEIDPVFSVPVEANAVYEVHFVLLARGPNITVTWDIPANADTWLRNTRGPRSSSSNPHSTLARIGSHNWTSEIAYGIGVDAAVIVEEGVLTTTDSPGTLQLKWAQSSPNNSYTIRLPGTKLSVRRVH